MTKPISEAAAEKPKRGRPSKVTPMLRSLYSDRCERHQRNMAAQLRAVQFCLDDERGPIPGIERIFNDNKVATSVWVELGYIYDLGHVTGDDIREFAREANRMIVEGHKVKDAAAILRVARLQMQRDREAS